MLLQACFHLRFTNAQRCPCLFQSMLPINHLPAHCALYRPRARGRPRQPGGSAAQCIRTPSGLRNRGVNRAMLSRIRATQAVGMPLSSRVRTPGPPPARDDHKARPPRHIPDGSSPCSCPSPTGPPHLRGISLPPPAVQFPEIDAAIDKHLHAAGAAGLPWPPWCVHPDIHPLHQVLGQ